MKSTAQKLADYRMELRAHYISMLAWKRRNEHSTTRPKPSRQVFPRMLDGMIDRIDAEELAKYEHEKITE